MIILTLKADFEVIETHTYQPETPLKIPITILGGKSDLEVTPEELAEVLKPYTLRRLSFTEILAAQQAIDRLYLDNGYITSGTFIHRRCE